MSRSALLAVITESMIFSAYSIDIMPSKRDSRACMAWIVEYDDDFEAELAAFPEAVDEEIAALAGLPRQFGPQLRRRIATR